MLRRVAKLLGAALLLAGLCLLGYPIAEQWRTEAENRAAVQAFTAQAPLATPAPAGADPEAEADTPYAELLTQMQTYNAEIYANHQQGLVDAFSYRDNLFDFATAGLPDDMIGYLDLPALGEQLPLYIGANAENLAKGAAVLSQTSMPLGGPDTNCVVAAHRGYYGAKMLLDVEQLTPGDTVTLTNLWGTLTYTVAKCIVIQPDDIDAIKIQPGQDMLTLVTCHPYGQNYQRYVVYCTRVEAEGAAADAGAGDGAPAALPDGVGYESSASTIHNALLANYLALAAVATVLVLMVVSLVRERR